MSFKSFKSLCHYAHKANIIISQKFNGKFTLEDINNYIAKLDEKISSQSIDKNIKNKYIRIKNYLLFLKDYINFNYREYDKFVLSNNFTISNGYKEFEFDYNKLRNYYLNNNKKEKIIHALKNEKYFLDNIFTVNLSKKNSLNYNCDKKEIDSIKKLLIFEKLKFQRLINFKDSLSDAEFFELYSYFYQLDDIGLKNIYAQTIYKNPKKYIVDTNGYITLILKNNSFKTENHSLIVEFYSNKNFESKYYTLRELAKQKYNKDIFVITTRPGEIIDEEEKNIRNKLYGNFPCVNNEIDVLINEYHTNKDVEDVCKIYPNIIKTLRDSIDGKQLLEDYDEYVKDYNKSMKNLENYNRTKKMFSNEDLDFNNN